ncbi:MAG: Smr/MutS family protein [Acidobacteria bacterium]|nr:Smr/MutS family protein [Acidobacteriota bacterium]
MVPASLSHTSASVLEFDSLRGLLQGYAASPLGRARIAALVPSGDPSWIERQHRLVAEVREFLRVGARFDFAGLADPEPHLVRAGVEGIALETAAIQEILSLLDRASQWCELCLHPPSALAAPLAELNELSCAIADFSALLRFFHGKILPDGTLDDHASPELARLRRELEKQKRYIQQSLGAYLRRLSEGGAVQDELITIRGERFVIPVRAEQKKRVGGVVHGTSSSGQTVFVEPLETIEQNNELVRLLEAEQAEVHRILLEMTKCIAAEAGSIQAAATTLAEIELQFAKARFADDYDCVAVRFQASHFLLRQARHPLLERNFKSKGGRVVPVTLELASSQRQLIISGPNTGGKTVALKTAGLLVLMAQSGIPVPATQAELPLFDALLADIGDYQSIEQNLSTFSAHVTRIDFVSRTATPQSLVLLDELGSATDPQEGAALAVAIADHFRRLGALSIVSTHHTALKVYAAGAEGVLNAAVGFDEATLRPTYELKLGVPGPSAGVKIAQQLGLNPEIIAAARARLGSDTQDIARFLDRLHSDLRRVEEERSGLARREQEVAREKSRLESVGQAEQRARVREIEKKLETLVRDLEYRAREVVSAVQDRAASLKLSKDAERRVAKLRREFREQFDSTVVAHSTGADRDDPNAQPSRVRNVAEGDTVKLKSLGRTGVVRRLLDAGALEVEIGAMKTRVARDDVAEVVVRASDSPVKAARARGVSVSLGDEGAAPPTEINVIGQTVDEATSHVEKFLDRAFLAGLARVRIVHGSGMGVLRKALRQYLKDHPQVASVAEPPQNEGGAGATVVELRL